MTWVFEFRGCQDLVVVGRRAARAKIAVYHQEQLAALLDRVREAFVRLDAGDIDVFELDDLIHHYKRSAAELWKFCGSTGGQWELAAAADVLADLVETTPGEEAKWFAAARTPTSMRRHWHWHWRPGVPCDPKTLTRAVDPFAALAPPVPEDGCRGSSSDL